MKITYIERDYIGDFKCIDRIKTISCVSSWTSGGLLYCKLDRFNYKTIENDFIVDIDGAQGEYIKRHKNIEAITDNNGDTCYKFVS